MSDRDGWLADLDGLRGALDRQRLLLDERAQDLERAREAVRLRDDFLAVATHELRTPLTSMMLQVQCLRRRARGGPESGGPAVLQPELELLDRQVRRLSRLVDALLDFSRVSTGRSAIAVEEMDLVGVVAEVAGRFGEELRRTGSSLRINDRPLLSFETGEGAPRLTASEELPGAVIGRWNPTGLEQIVGNLVGNAIKYGAGNPIDIFVGAQRDQVMISVVDGGIGIADADQARIFQQFERAVSERRYAGLGLGLWIVRQTVEEMGGQIRVQSEPGRGSCFEVVLPRAQGRESAGTEVDAADGATTTRALEGEEAI